jgi:hypothetical protein
MRISGGCQRQDTTRHRQPCLAVPQLCRPILLLQCRLTNNVHSYFYIHLETPTLTQAVHIYQPASGATMAYDTGGQARRNSYMASTNYPQYDPSIYTDPRVYQSSTSNGQPKMSSSRKANSDTPVYVPPADFQTTFPPPPPGPPPAPEQPIADAVNHAFDNSSAATQLSPEMIARITEQVITSLRAELNTTKPASSAPPVQPYANPSTFPVMNMHVPPPPPNPPASAVPLARAPSFSPVHMRESSQPFVAPGSIPGTTSAAAQYGTSPRAQATMGASRSIPTPPTPDRGSGGEWDEATYFDRRQRRPSRTRPSPESAPRDIPLRRRNSRANRSPQMNDSAAVKENLSERYGDSRTDELQPDRPGTTRLMSNYEETVVEKMWQPLFDTDCKPTPRLHQFLRGIALHLVCYTTFQTETISNKL